MTPGRGLSSRAACWQREAAGGVGDQGLARLVLAEGPRLGHLVGRTSGTGMGWGLGNAPSRTAARLLAEPPHPPWGQRSSP